MESDSSSSRSGWQSSVRAGQKALPELPQDEPRKSNAWRLWIRKISINLWLWELLSLFVSMSCVGAIMIILAEYKDKPVPEWSYGLTINGLISILAVVARSSIVVPIAEAISQLKWCWFWDHERPVMDFDHFDLASRGPWGGITMLFQVPIWSAGAFGAALTVAALAVEPFLQQIPAYSSRDIVTAEATMPRTSYFKEFRDNGINVGVFMEPGLKSAFYEGLLEPFERDTTVAPFCPTGNCTYAPYTSMAVCSACASIMSSMQFGPAHGDLTKKYIPPGRFEGRGSANEYFSRSNYQQYTNTYSAGGWAEWSHAFAPSVNRSLLDFASVYWPPFPEKDIGGNRNWSPFDEITHYNDTFRNTPPSGAHECILYFCVQSYNATVQNGVLNETVISSWPPPNTTIHEDTQDPDKLWSTTRNVTYEANVTLIPPGQDVAYNFDMSTWYLIRDYFSGMFHEKDISTRSSRAAGDEVPQAMHDEQTRTLGGEQRIFNYTVPRTDGPQPRMEKIAKSLTNYIRQSSDPAMAMRGDARSIETVVSARWEWSIFPVALLTVTFIFLASTVAITAKRGVPVWKGSSLAAILHGLDESSRQSIVAEKLGHMEANARKYHMRLPVSAGHLQSGGPPG